MALQTQNRPHAFMRSVIIRVIRLPGVFLSLSLPLQLRQAFQGYMHLQAFPFLSAERPLRLSRFHNQSGQRSIYSPCHLYVFQG